ncbi:MAG: hypothetical protein WA432_01885 [Candidatus Babeliaceae bacterium]
MKHHVVILLFASAVITFSLYTMQPSRSLSAVHKQELADLIKGDIYMMFSQDEVCIKNNFTNYSKNNADLEKDLYTLYTTLKSAVNDHVAQKQLNFFCTKWHLPTIQISERYDWY